MNIDSHRPRDPLHPHRDERCELAVLLERAYRLALWLHDAERVDRSNDASGAVIADEPVDSPAAFAVHVASSELVDVLDEARARLVAGMGHAIGPTIRALEARSQDHSSAPLDR